MTNLFNDYDLHCHICKKRSDFVLKIRCGIDTIVYLPTCEEHTPSGMVLFEKTYVQEEVFEREICNINLQQKIIELLEEKEEKECTNESIQ